ncbi:MFS transporter [Beijerinckia indica]|uniref:Lysosomal dipeptide transporter MFSD1 n=1 Tax=Beijerinckia indica subsp. indica (strain ATCC 9039 / DSM 1715 / NCIMB 8712) TaxID=395963 RepID=B2IEK5_BEII9|nr:MFS transporter [Beijerinckia indica]ACB96947.1 major facilitator superfamily MFS_1 [Beijerinckia indica subsp. indica ATCC 9039]
MSITTAEQIPSQAAAAPSQPATLQPLYFLAWLLCAIFYFYQYAVRSAPGVMQEQLTQAWGGNHIGAMISAYYIAYAVMALLAGVLLDRYGAHATIPAGIAVVGIGSVVFAQGSESAGMIGFVLQAIGAIFAFIGSSYVAARYLPASMLAIFVGFTQCLGMAGAAFGSKPVQFLIDPTGSFHIAWQHVWLGFAVLGFVLAAATWLVMPRDKGDSAEHHGTLSVASFLAPFRTVFSNPQSWFAGMIGGLLFVPTTIGALVWGTPMLHQGEHTTMAFAASDVSMVPIGWVIGCPLLGYISDRIGRRKPVLIIGSGILLVSCLTAISVPVGVLPPYSVALLLGIASGAAMIPFSVIKEANIPQVKGTAAGVMNFLVFLTTGLMSPVVSALMRRDEGQMTMDTFRMAFTPLIGGVALAIILSFFLKETGARATQSKQIKPDRARRF